MRVNPVKGGDNSVAGRIFAVIDAFWDSPVEQSLADIATRTGISKSTVWRTLNDLVARRLVERTASGFRLGLHLFELGQRVERQRVLRDRTLPFMEDLFEATHEIVHLGVLDGTEVVYVEKIVGHRSMEAPSRVGARLPAHSSALGKVILAFSPKSAVDRVIGEGLRPLTPYTIVTADRLLDELATIRRELVGFDRMEGNLRVACVAAPILWPNDRVLGAISITGPVNRLNLDNLAPAVKTAALGAGRALLGNRYVSPSVTEWNDADAPDGDLTA